MTCKTIANDNACLFCNRKKLNISSGISSKASYLHVGCYPFRTTEQHNELLARAYNWERGFSNEDSDVILCKYFVCFLNEFLWSRLFTSFIFKKEEINTWNHFVLHNKILPSAKKKKFWFSLLYKRCHYNHELSVPVALYWFLIVDDFISKVNDDFQEAIEKLAVQSKAKILSATSQFEATTVLDPQGNDGAALFVDFFFCDALSALMKSNLKQVLCSSLQFAYI